MKRFFTIIKKLIKRTKKDECQKSSIVEIPTKRNPLSRIEQVRAELHSKGFEVWFRENRFGHSFIISVEKIGNAEKFNVEKEIPFSEIVSIDGTRLCDYFISKTIEEMAEELEQKILQEKENNNVKD